MVMCFVVVEWNINFDVFYFDVNGKFDFVQIGVNMSILNCMLYFIDDFLVIQFEDVVGQEWYVVGSEIRFDVMNWSMF